MIKPSKVKYTKRAAFAFAFAPFCGGFSSSRYQRLLLLYIIELFLSLATKENNDRHSIYSTIIMVFAQLHQSLSRLNIYIGSFVVHAMVICAQKMRSGLKMTIWIFLKFEIQSSRYLTQNDQDCLQFAVLVLSEIFMQRQQQQQTTTPCGFTQTKKHHNPHL